MKLPRVPHRWDVTPRRAIQIQRELASLVRQAPLPARPRFFAGTDMAFSSDGKRCLAGAVVWDRESETIVERQLAVRPVRFPYVPGLLSFREAPAVLAALRKLRDKPDVLMVDGQGLAHPRRMGLACHLGVVANIPTIGCAKSRLCGTHQEPRGLRGCWSLLTDAGEIVGAVVRTRTGVRCVYVSVGHMVTIEQAISLVLECSTHYRLPEPTRLAHHLVTSHRRHI
jgi:deoxyribonuclease V